MTDPRREIRQLRELVYRQQEEIRSLLAGRIPHPKTRAPLLAQEFRCTQRWSGTLGKLTETVWQQFTGSENWPPPRIAECSAGVITLNFNMPVAVTVETSIVYESGSSVGDTFEHVFTGPLSAPFEHTRRLMLWNQGGGFSDPFIGQKFLSMRCRLPEGHAGYTFTMTRPGVTMSSSGVAAIFNYAHRLILEVP